MGVQRIEEHFMSQLQDRIAQFRKMASDGLIPGVTKASW